jgi:DNA-binding transcriptional regulator GbsR (MarR family)
VQGVSGTEEVREAFVSLWGRMGPFWGVPPTTARVYGWLFSRRDAASADQVVEALGMSRGAVSMACRELRDWGLIHPERKSGSRVVMYRPETDLEKAMRNIVATRKRREWDPILEHLREWIPKLESERSADAAVFRERLEAMESLVALADSMAGSFLGGGLVETVGLKMMVASARGRARRAQKSRAGARRSSKGGAD